MGSCRGGTQEHLEMWGGGGEGGLNKWGFYFREHQKKYSNFIPEPSLKIVTQFYSFKKSEQVEYCNLFLFLT